MAIELTFNENVILVV